jgi:hypothetical protein
MTAAKTTRANIAKILIVAYFGHLPRGVNWIRAFQTRPFFVTDKGLEL